MRKMKTVTVTQKNGHKFTAKYHDVKVRILPISQSTEFSDAFYFTGIVYAPNAGKLSGREVAESRTECYASSVKFH